MNADRTLLTDTHRALLAPLLPSRVGRRGVVAKDNRGSVEAVRWVGRTGLPRRDLPPHLGQWHRVFVRFSRWCTRGVWDQVLAALPAKRCPARGSGRCSSTRPPGGPTRTRPGPEKKGPQPLGRSRGGFSTKLHVAGDGAGGLLALALTAGQAGDAPQAADLLAPLLAPARQVLADTAYDSDALRA